LNSSRKIVVLTTLAEYQTPFWISVARDLERADISSVVCSFDSRSSDLLAKAGIVYYDIPSLCSDDLQGKGSLDAEALFDRFGLTDIPLLRSHEKLAFGIEDDALLDRKLAAYLRALEHVMADVNSKANSVTVIQELGGFLSVLACYLVAKNAGIDHYFLEPSFFKGRFFALKNQISAPKIRNNACVVASEEVRTYISDAISKQVIVIPEKDRHHYSAALKKVSSFKNLKRFLMKIIDQYVFGRHQEFGHNFRYAFSHLKMAANYMRMRRAYKDVPRDRPFLYFPFHVPNDVALTLRSPQYVDQLAILDFMLRVMPRGVSLAVKEHPAMVGALDAGRLKSMARRYSNLVILRPSINNFEVLRAADGVLSINSKSGAEAAMLAKPVIVLGDAFYTHCRFVKHVSCLSDLKSAIAEMAPSEASPDEIADYFQAVYDATFVGEIYVDRAENVKAVGSAIRAFFDGGVSLAALDEPGRGG